MLIEKDDQGNWHPKGINWEDLRIGKPITKEISERLYGCLWKLMEYEDTGLSPDQVETMLNSLTAMEKSEYDFAFGSRKNNQNETKEKGGVRMQILTPEQIPNSDFSLPPDDILYCNRKWD